MKDFFDLKSFKEYIFREERPFLSCHASTLVELDNGETLVAWFGGTAEKNPDVAIWYSRRKNGKWSYPEKLADEEGLAHWNPVLFKASDKKVILYYKVGENSREWYTKYIISKDNGVTWTKPLELVKGDVGGRGPVKNKPIILEDGTWLSPASIESVKKVGAENIRYWDAFVDISNDQGITWNKSEIVPLDRKKYKKEGLIQPTLWESETAKVHMFCRNSREWICRSDSIDGGRTWTEAYDTKLPHNNSGIDLAKVKKNILVLAYNPVRLTSTGWGARTPLVISFSKDNGVNWDDTYTLEDEEGEYSYPAIVSDGERISITYTWNRKRIVYLSFSINDII